MTTHTEAHKKAAPKCSIRIDDSGAKAACVGDVRLDLSGAPVLLSLSFLHDMAEVATARDKWEASVAQIREGTRLYLTNDFASVSGRGLCVVCKL